jgi:queuosine precursor transporter
MTATRTTLVVAGLAMAFIIYISNVLVQMPINDWLTYGTFTFPLAFLITDLTNRFYGSRNAFLVVFVGFIMGGVLSILAGDVRIGLASVSAFLIGQVLDVTIFNKMRSLAWWKAPLVSSFVASAVDTAIFYTLAFSGQDWPWQQVALGDFGVKVAMALLLLVPFKLLIAWWAGNRAAA